MNEIGRAYGAQAERYIELFGSTSQVHADDLAFIGRHLSSSSGLVLDLGCGPGHLTEYLRANGVQATGIDVVPEFIRHARATHPHGRYVIGSLEQLPVPDRSVDAILAWYSLIHLDPDELDDALAELARVMKPGGALVAGWFDGAEAATFDHKIASAWRRPMNDFARRLDTAGFTEIERMQRPAGNGHRPHAAVAATRRAP